MKRIVFALTMLLPLFVFSKIRITEIQSSNTFIALSDDYFEYADWIELYNDSSASVDLSGQYITDDKANPFKWQLPSGTVIDAKGFLMIWADKYATGLHTNFGLSSNGEFVGLFESNGVLVDSVTFPLMPTNHSYSWNEAQKSWYIEAIPTPNDANPVSIKSIVLSERPSFSAVGGVYTSSVTLILSTQETNAKIYYSLDGSMPKKFVSKEYSSPIVLDTTTTVRVIVVSSGKTASEIVTHTYIIDKQHEIPILSISTDPDNLWNDTIGIYTIGTNGILGANDIVANWQQNWSRTANIEYFVNGKEVINQEADLSISGFIRSMDNKSLRIDAKNKYGNGTFDYRFFESRENTSFKTLTIRNGGYPENASTMIRDGIMHESITEYTDIDNQGHQACALYLNGVYWGLYNIRERLDDNYFEKNYGVDPNTVDHGEFKYEYLAQKGIIDDLLSLRSYMDTNALDTQQEYDHIDNEMNINQCLDYHISNIYFANTDWPGNNVEFWRSKENGIKWRWIITDVNHGLGFAQKPDHNTLVTATAETNNDWFNSLASTQFPRNLLKSPIMRDQFIQRFATHLNLTFAEQRMNTIIDKYYNNVKNEMPYHIERWRACEKQYLNIGCPVKSMDTWDSQVMVIKDFVKKRKVYVEQHIIDYFGLTGKSEIIFETNDTSSGEILVNGINISSKIGASMTYFNNVPMNIKAKAKPGFVFIGWESYPDRLYDTLVFTPSTNATIKAIFAPVNKNILSGKITKNTHLTLAGSPYLVTNDIIVDSNVVLSADPGVQIQMSENRNIVVYGKLSFIGTSSNPIVIEPEAESAIEKWGCIMINYCTDTTIMDHVILRKASRGYESFNHKAAISIYYGQVKLNHMELMDNFGDPVFAQYAHVELRNSKLHSEITGDLINVKHGFAIVDSCEFIGNNKVDVDGIDYDDIHGGVISNNRIHGLVGGNSDAIDLGEGSSGLKVFNNFLYNCSDKGVSVGQGSICELKNNVIVSCNLGVGIKDTDSYALIDHQTFFANKTAVACYEKNLGSGGGSSDILNTIFSKNLEDTFVDNLSAATINYCLSDVTTHSGTGNIFGDAMFVSPYNDNFNLRDSSPAIDAGDPLYAKDSDFSNTDMGAYKYVSDNTALDYSVLKINEIMTSNTNYEVDEYGEYEDWIEIYDPSSKIKYLTNVYLSDNAQNLTKFELIGTDLKGLRFTDDGYLILWADGDTLQGGNHLNFKLSASLSESIYLSYIDINLDTIVIDSIVNPKIIASNQSYGRYGDGENVFEIFTYPSISASNKGTPPVFKSLPASVAYVSEEYHSTILVSDLENDSVKFEFENVPNWLDIEIVGNTFVLYGTPLLFDTGQFVINIEAIDSKNNSTYLKFRLNVSEYLITDIEQIEQNVVYTVFPNPSSDLIRFNINSTSQMDWDSELICTDISGRTFNLQALSVIKDDYNYNSIFDVGHLESGIYILNMNLKNGMVLRQKFMVDSK